MKRLIIALCLLAFPLFAAPTIQLEIGSWPNWNYFQYKTTETNFGGYFKQNEQRVRLHVYGVALNQAISIEYSEDGGKHWRAIEGFRRFVLGKNPHIYFDWPLIGQSRIFRAKIVD